MKEIYLDINYSWGAEVFPPPYGKRKIIRIINEKPEGKTKAGIIILFMFIFYIFIYKRKKKKKKKSFWGGKETQKKRRQKKP